MYMINVIDFMRSSTIVVSLVARSLLSKGFNDCINIKI